MTWRLLLALALGSGFALPAGAEGIAPITVQGDRFLNDQGQPVRFWGVNLVALYPTAQQAQRIAADLAYHQINLVRPHHLMRPSRDWVWNSQVHTLNQFAQGLTREPDADAWARFDQLNAALRAQGIYLMLAARWSRTYSPYDVDIIETTSADTRAWMMAMDELNRRHWKKAIDARKLLPMVDERVAALDVEFTRNLLNHVNPHTGVAYGRDPQVLTLEVINEYSSEYVLICRNDLPAYFQDKLVKQWEAFALDAGLLEPGDLYQAEDAQKTRIRADFFRHLDQAHFERVKQAARDCGFAGAVTFSNLWRGERALEMHAQLADYIEDHAYVNPRVIDSREDFIFDKGKTLLAGKPYIIGEFNQSEGSKGEAEAPYRTMLPLAAAAYGAHQGYDGIVWFAWQHGDRDLTPEGTAKTPDRQPHLGTMVADEMLRDHLRTTGLIFRQGLVDPAKQQIRVQVGPAQPAGDYGKLMRPQGMYRPGWQSIHAFARSFATADPGQVNQSWRTQEPPTPLVSDTGQITKDLERKQLRILAPRAEAFSGELADTAWDGGYRHLTLHAKAGFATVVLVTLDGQPLASARRLLISRTYFDAPPHESDALPITLTHLAGRAATFRVTRPVAQSIELTADSAGTLTLPETNWHEAEIELK